MRQMIDKITERYLQEREHILEQTIHDIISEFQEWTSLAVTAKNSNFRNPLPF